MITVKDIDRILSAVAPVSLSESWDNDGVMLCADVNTPVKKVLVMLEVTDAGAVYAAEHGYNLIITHHPLIFKPLSRLTGGDFCLFGRLMRAGISVLSYHTRMDSAPGGVNDVAAQLLGLCDVQPFGGERGDAGRIGRLPAPLAPVAFAEKLKAVFGCPDVRASLFRSSEKEISHVAFLGGAGKSFFYDAYAAGADAFVTGEAAHNTFLDCTALDMCLFECGHYYTENHVCDRFVSLLADAFGKDLDCNTYDVKSPCVCL